MMTYKEFAEFNKCDIEIVMRLNESEFGCTHYDTPNNRYLVLWNDDPSNNNVPGRQRWTKAHELGHVILKHLPMAAAKQMPHNGFHINSHRDFEEEADYFTSVLLCPPPLFKQLHIYSPADIMNIFGLSEEAANNRWREYLRWRDAKRAPEEFTWEERMRSLFRLKERAGTLKHPPFRFTKPRSSAINIWKEYDEFI